MFGAVLFLVLVMFAGGAAADGSGDEGSSAAAPLSEALSLEAEVPTNPVAAQELPHIDLTREEAIALDQGVFQAVLEAPAGIFEDLEVDRFLSNHAAIVPAEQDPEGILVGEGGNPTNSEQALLESTLPLRAAGEPVDLSLEHSGGMLQPEAPLVDIQIPTELGDDISLPEVGIEIGVADAPVSIAPSISNGTTAFYPNVATDSDFIAAPTPTGVETFTILRSPEAPRSATFDLSLPADAQLMEDRGGAVVRKNGEVVMTILPPTAYDAAGQPVPVSLAVSGTALTLTVDPDPSTSWPVIVDPIYETYSWWSGNQAGSTDWQLTKNTPEMGGGFGHNANSTNYFWFVISQPGTFTNGQAVKLAHSVPRFEKEDAEGHPPTSYILSMKLTNLSMVTGGGSLSPAMFAGIWNPSLNTWAGKAPSQAAWGHEGNGGPMSGAELTITSGNDKGAKTAYGISLWTIEPTAFANGQRQMSVGGVSLETTDEDDPSVVSPSVSNIWVNQTATEPVTATVKDTGLGAKSATFSPTPEQAAVTVQNSCPGTSASPCPSVWPVTLATNQYNPALMSQGEDRIPIVGKDVLGRVSTVGKAQVNVDHTAPGLGLSGTLTEQGTLGTKLAQYSLKYSASDGDEATPEALTPFGGAGSGEGKTGRPLGVAADGKGNVWVVDRENNRVMKFDEAGNFLFQFGSKGSGNGQLLEPRGIAIGTKGTLWVTDTGNNRVQEFSTSGQYLQQFGSKGTGKTQFQEVYGITAAPGGVLWVGDMVRNRIAAFRETPTSGQDPYFIREATGSASNSNSTDLLQPNLMTVDSFGNLWVADAGHHRIQKFNSEGKYLLQFGTEGAGQGQLSWPGAIAIPPSGNLIVVDSGNNRVQEFKPDGTFMRQFGSNGAGNGQFLEPRGIILGPGNSALIADAGNHRVVRWAHVDKDPQSGVVKSEIKVDGTVVDSTAPGCATKNCTINREWTLKADDYPVGQHNVEVIATDGVDLATTSKITVETHGDLAAPSVALSGAMTEQATLGTTRPTYKLNISATDPGSAEERKSGVASTTIKVDGKVVDTASPGCPAGGCSISREWILKSDSYSVGAHVVQVTATDAAGRSTTKSLMINIARDTTAPELTATNPIFTAAGGWVTQKSYVYFPSATDVNGYGLASLVFKVDGVTVATTTKTCEAGGCSAQLLGSLNMASYEGGAHPAELKATDGAGNWRSKKWTINVDPSGTIPAEEATQTLEAMEATVPSEHEFQPVAGTEDVLEDQEIEAGNNPHFIEEEGQIASTGVTATTEIDPSTDTIKIEGTEGPIEVEPDLSASAPEISEESAAVLPGASTATDTVVRPEYNGAQMFTTIREESAPDTYEWHIKLGTGQYLDQRDPQHVAVKFSDGEEAWLISAEPAHDATGKEVFTALTIDGTSDLILTVQHKGKQLVYPVAAGQAYETGYATVALVLPDPPPPTEEEEGDGVEGLETEDLGPVTEGEFAENADWLSSAQPHRPKGKPISKKAARRLVRNIIHGKVPPPTFNIQGGPSGVSSEAEETEPVVKYTCSDWYWSGCDIWNVDFKDPDTDIPTKYGVNFRWTGKQWVRTYISRRPTHCSWYVNDWWIFALEINVEECGTHKPYEAKPGSGTHLTYYIKYETVIFYVAEMPGDVSVQLSTLVDQVFPSGYQRSVIKLRESPFSEA